MLPIHHPEDMLKEFEKKNPDKGETEFRELLNKDEDIDMWEFYS